MRSIPYLRGSMSSATILSAASTSFFWSTGAAAVGVPHEDELGLELELWGKEGLGVIVCGGGLVSFCLAFGCGVFLSVATLI